MDHHCPWVNNCVGEKNQKFFVLFTVFILYYVLYLAYSVHNQYLTILKLYSLALYCCYVNARIVLVCQPICLVFTFRMEAMFLVYTSCNSSFFDIFRFWSIAICNIHHGNVCHTTTSHMLRWNGNYVSSLWSIQWVNLLFLSLIIYKPFLFIVY